MEIGGYIELDTYTGKPPHEGAVALNYARNALTYLIEAYRIRRIWIPKFLCATVADACRKAEIQIMYYSIGQDLRPVMTEKPTDGDWLYLVNYYGQIGNEEIAVIHKQYPRLIVDNVQAFFQDPVPGVPTLYTCRKFFGVPDGAYLYTDVRLNRELPEDRSADRMRHLLGRYEDGARAHYGEYSACETCAEDIPLRQMSPLTQNLMRALDLSGSRRKREENFAFLQEAFAERNKLQLSAPTGPFMYPLWLENGGELRKYLQERDIFIPTLWPDVFDLCESTDLEYNLAQDILPLPVDQRYGPKEMEYMVSLILDYEKQRGKA